MFVEPVERRLAGLIRDEVSQIAGVALIGIGRTVSHTARIEMSTRGTAVRRGAIPFIVNMKSMFAWGQPGYLGFDAHTAGFLGESNGAMNRIILGRVQLREGLCPAVRHDPFVVMISVIRLALGRTAPKANRGRCEKNRQLNSSFHEFP